MSYLCKGNGKFSLHNSDKYVGSFITKNDVKEILGIDDDSVNTLPFKVMDDREVIDENDLAKRMKTIPCFPPKKSASLDEYILKAIIKLTYPNAEVETQVPIKVPSKKRAYKMDLKVSLCNKTIFVEFDGPSHFSITRYGDPNPVWEKKNLVENATGIEVVKWPFWVQRCESNVQTLFDKSIKGKGVLWSTNSFFGDFFFQDSALIIEKLNSRFNINNSDISSFYGPNTIGRFNPEHPIIEKILQGKADYRRLVPKGASDEKEWLPERIKSMLNKKNLHQA